VSTSEHGKITDAESPEALTAWLTERLRGAEDTPQSTLQLAREVVRHNWRVKLAALAGVILLWAVAIKQNESPRNIFATLGPGVEQGFTVPVDYYNLPEGLQLSPERTKRVRIRIKGEADLMNFIDAGRLRIRINLRGAGAGPAAHTISTRDIDLPSRIRLVGAEPPEVRLRLEKTAKTSAAKP
jgi:hypothetical protein